MSNAFWAYGSVFKIASTPVVEIQDISGPGMSRNAIEVTHNDGTTGSGYKDFIPGWRDGGEISISANWLPKAVSQGNATGLLAKFNSNALESFEIETPAGVDITFSGIVTAFSPSLPLEEQGKLEFTVKISGKPTIG